MSPDLSRTCSAFFTFQSGTIQATLSNVMVAECIVFTFQSGTIQACHAVDAQTYQVTLHSNLVQFKLSRL